MITDKKLALQPILESIDGIHLTAYLLNDGNLTNLQSQLRRAIAEANEWLLPVLSTEERKRFLEPLYTTLKDNKILKNIKGNIGIFRNEVSFRVLNIPMDVEPTCQVATSFHVKPLLRWLQGDEDFLLLGVERSSAHLYLGSQHSFKLVDSLVFSRLNARRDVYACINDWIAELTANAKPKLFIAGLDINQANAQKLIKYRHLANPCIAETFSEANVQEVCQKVRAFLKEDSKKNLERSLLEFRFAEEENKARKNIFQISKAVVQGKVRKLIVTDDLSIFGKIDHKSGGLSLHPVDLDHEDDCVLDDLAQLVLSQGGEVVVAKREEIPKGRPILAILDDEGESLLKVDDFQYEVLQQGV